MWDDVMKAAAYIRQKVSEKPVSGIVLGSGLGALADALEDKLAISYSEIPGFPESGVKGHAAQMVFGKLGDRSIVAMQGRFHYYEGFDMKQLTFPIYVLKQIGVKNMVVTNACGAINASFEPGDLMLITDHMNMTGMNPLRGKNDERFGPRFPDMTEAYNRELMAIARKTAEELSIPLQEGVYAFFPGPCYETAAEIRALKVMGADTVGMSTVPEVTVAHYLGMRVMGLSCITNMATGIAKTKHTHEAVLAAANEAGEKFCRLAAEVLKRLPD